MSHHGLHRKKIPAAALGYAISFLLLTALVCCGVLFISSVNKRLEVNYTLREHLLLDNYLSLSYGAKVFGKEKITLIHPAGDTSDIFIKPWGAFRVVTAHTRHGSKLVSKSALVGYEMEAKLPALYLSDLNQALKLCGNTKIEGEAFLPERGAERSYIAGKNYENEKLLYGELKRSESHLPSLNPVYSNLTLSSFTQTAKKIDFFSRDSSFSFDQETVLVSQIEPLTIHNHISGNIVLHSFDSIFVASTAQLENVILVAPVVRFEAGFKGSVQVIAHQKIVCEKNVRLMYPSILVLNELSFNAGTRPSSVELQEEAKVIGGILLTSQDPNFRKPVHLSMAFKSTAGGLVYNQGETFLQGKITGNLYTQQFILHAGGGVYTNHLLDAKISSVQLPVEFLYPDWLQTMEFSNAKIISCF